MREIRSSLRFAGERAIVDEVIAYLNMGILYLSVSELQSLEPQVKIVQLMREAYQNYRIGLGSDGVTYKFNEKNRKWEPYLPALEKPEELTD